MKAIKWTDVEAKKMSEYIDLRPVHGEKITLGYFDIRKGAEVPVHSHHNEQISCVLRGKMRFYNDGFEAVVEAGGIIMIPPNEPHGAEALEDSNVIDIFSPSREDWQKGDDSYLRGKR